MCAHVYTWERQIWQYVPELNFCVSVMCRYHSGCCAGDPHLPQGSDWRQGSGGRWPVSTDKVAGNHPSSSTGGKREG